MQIWHHVTTSRSRPAAEELEALGLDFRENSNLLVLDINENSQTWPVVKEWMQRHHAVDMVTTKFTAAEISRSGWLCLVPTWHHGFPQPRDDEFGYLRETYDCSEYCTQCGSGLKQSGPFQMTAEPRWGRREILQLNWIFDEFFVTPELWVELFQPLGVACRDVLGRKREVLKTVVQLDVSEAMDLAMDGYRATGCPACGRERFEPHCRGYLPKFQEQPEGKIVRSRQTFGSGASSYTKVFVVREIAEALKRTSGVSLWPVVS